LSYVLLHFTVLFCSECSSYRVSSTWRVFFYLILPYLISHAHVGLFRDATRAIIRLPVFGLFVISQGSANHKIL